MKDKEKIIVALLEYIDMLNSKKYQIENLVGSITECEGLEVYNQILEKRLEVQELVDELNK